MQKHFMLSFRSKVWIYSKLLILYDGIKIKGSAKQGKTKKKADRYWRIPLTFTEGQIYSVSEGFDHFF